VHARHARATRLTHAGRIGSELYPQAIVGSGRIDSYCCWTPYCREGVIAMLISALVTFLVIILVLYLVNMLPVDGRMKRIIQIVVIIIGVLSLLRLLGVWI
jgi:hypothetical protein